MASATYFTPAFFTFLRDLAANNNRDWFATNKERYETAVQAPAVRFVADAGPRLRALSPSMVADAKPYGGSISRIYRDVRFSRDKSPFRADVAIFFSHRSGHGRMPGLPGFALHLEAGKSRAYSGVWRPGPPGLKKIRDAIAKHPDSWKKAVRSTLEVEGEILARVPPGYPSDHPFAKDLRRKDFYASIPFRDSEVTSPKFMDRFLAACQTMDPLNRFLAQAMEIPW
jgi:uncharacterized protein (TIGR02453 family)